MKTRSDMTNLTDEKASFQIMKGRNGCQYPWQY